MCEGCYSWLNGNYVEVFDSMVVEIEINSGLKGYVECCLFGFVYFLFYVIGV